MATPNLGIPEVAASQNQKEVTINEGLTRLDESFNDSIEYAVNAAFDIDGLDFVRNVFFKFNAGTIAVDFVVGLPSTVPKRLFIIHNATGYNADIGGYALATDTIALLYKNGVSVVVVGTGSVGGGGGGTPTNIPLNSLLEAARFWRGVWAIGSSYNLGQQVENAGAVWTSLTDANVGNRPIDSSPFWSKQNPGGRFIPVPPAAVTHYFSGQILYLNTVAYLVISSTQAGSGTIPTNNRFIPISQLSDGEVVAAVSRALGNSDWQQAGGGMGGTNVAANPAGIDGVDLTRITIAGVNLWVKGVKFIDIDGRPARAPLYAGEAVVDNQGRLHTAGTNRRHVITPNTITREVITNGDFAYWNNVHDTEPGAVGSTNGHFYFDTRYNVFIQNRGGVRTYVSFGACLTYLTDAGIAVPANVLGATMLGEFVNQQAAADRFVTLADRATAKRVYVDDDTVALYRITAYNVGMDSVVVEPFWRDYPVSANEVKDIVRRILKVNPAGDATTALAKLDYDGTIYSIEGNGGGGGGGGGAVLDPLYTGAELSADTNNIALEGSREFTDYSVIYAEFKRGGQFWTVTVTVANFITGATWYRVTDSDGAMAIRYRSNTEFDIDNGSGTFISLYGLKEGAGDGGGGGGGSAATADLLVEQIGATVTNLTLPDSRVWVATGITVPESTHVLLIDSGLATDDFHVVDWDTIRAKAAGVVGQASIASQYETIEVTHANTTYTVRIGHDDANNILLANNVTNLDFILGHFRVERLLAPTAVAETASTYLELTDTPDEYVGQARKAPRVKEDETGLEFIDEILHIDSLPSVGSLPDVSATASEMVILPHAYTEGVRGDAVVTIGTSGAPANLFGYSPGSPFTAFGAIDKQSPLHYILGLGTAAEYSLRVIASYNRDWLDDFTHVDIDMSEYLLSNTYRDRGVWVRNLINPPNTLSGVTVTLNLKRADGTHYFTDGSTVTHPPGIYQKTADSYQRLIYSGLIHFNDLGEPSFLPTAAAQSYVDNLGRLWVSGGTVTTIANPVQSTSENFIHSLYAEGAFETFSELNSAKGDGGFTYSQVVNAFIQVRIGHGEPSVVNATWRDVFRYIVQYVSDTPENRRLRDDTEWMGNFATDELAANHLNSTITEIFQTKTYYYHLSGTLTTPRYISTFVAQAVTIVNTFFWRGPYVVASDVHILITQHITPQDGSGAPHAIPTRENQFTINEFGNLYVAASKTVRHAADPSFTAASVATVVWAKWLGAFRHSPQITERTLGAFEYRSVLSGSFTQEQMLGSQTDTSWGGIRNWFLSHSSEAAGAPAQLFSHNSVGSVFLFGPSRAFATDAEAALYVANNNLAAVAPTTPFVYFLGSPHDEENWVMRLANAAAYNAATGTSIYNALHWVGPLALKSDIPSTEGGGGLTETILFENNAGDTVAGVKNLTTGTSLNDYTFIGFEISVAGSERAYPVIVASRLRHGSGLTILLNKTPDFRFRPAADGTSINFFDVSNNSKLYRVWGYK